MYGDDEQRYEERLSQWYTRLALNKRMSAASQIVREGGSIIIAADCLDGIPDHGEYGKMIEEAEGPESLLTRICSPGFKRQDMWQAQIHALICQKAAEIDLIIDRPGMAEALIEIKSSDNIRERDIRMLDRFTEDFIQAEAFCISRDRVKKIISNVTCLCWEEAIKELGL